MASSPDCTRPGLVVRDYQSEDTTAVCTLIEADRLPGQPPCTAENLASSAQEPMLVPVADWMPLPAGPHISVATDDNGRLNGVVAYLAWIDADIGAICWLHAREDPATLHALLAHTLGALTSCKLVEAVIGSPSGTPGPTGLPRARRTATHTALVQVGFTGRHQGSYLHRTLPAEPPVVPVKKLVADIFPYDSPPGHRLVLREAGEPVAEALVSLGSDHTAVIRWIETVPTHQRRNLACELLGQALALLTEHGAHHVIATVDHPAPATWRSHPVLRLFHSCGFTQVDTLWFYEHRHFPR
jgi:Acetyltransferase (GNAT) family